MVNSPLVTIIVPVYNVEKYLVRCLDSIVNQTYRNLEIIIVNDGSTDGSGEICRQYAEHDMRIRLFAQENQGLSAARNVGLDHMTGEYIVFVDSDDYISLSFVEVLLAQLMKYHVQMAICGRSAVHEEEDRRGQVYNGRKIECRLLSRDEIYAIMDKPKGWPFVAVWGRIYTRQLFETLRFDFGKINEDEFIYHRIYDQIEMLCYTETPLYYHVHTSNSITRKAGIRRIHPDVIEAFFIRLEYFQKYGNKKFIGIMRRKIMQAVLALCEQSGVGDKETKRELKRAAEEIEQITGGVFFSPQYQLYYSSPAVYRVLRTTKRRLKNVFTRMLKQARG